ncbi:hypothetical protein AVEN_265715-1, partial [Araneus ventricosus]
ANTRIGVSWSFTIFRYFPVRSQLNITQFLDILEKIEKDPLVTRLGCFSTTPERNGSARNGALQTDTGQKSKDEKVDYQKYGDLLFLISRESSTKYLGDKATRSTNNST